MAIYIREAYPRIDDALDQGRTVFLTDGTVTAKVTKVFGDADDITEHYLTLALAGFATKSFEISDSGILEGLALRDCKDQSLLIGPEHYLAQWPCDDPLCVANIRGLCSVEDCKGPCHRSKAKYKTARNAAKAYHTYTAEKP